MTVRILASLLLAVCAPPALQAEAPRVLVYQKNGQGFVHANLRACAEALTELGREGGFQAEVSSDPTRFTPDRLRGYRALIFANTNNEAFDHPSQREALQGYLRAGGGFVGIHSSTGSERDWDWFRQMQGAKFLRHPPLQTFTLTVTDPRHPATALLGPTWTRKDEFYLFRDLHPQIQVLLSGDPTALRDPKAAEAPGARLRGLAPLAWCHEFEGGRVFYTALGHEPAHYADPDFRRHLLGGIRWSMRIPAPPPEENRP
jgi:type 1 glutamine amidotransferase